MATDPAGTPGGLTPGSGTHGGLTQGAVRAGTVSSRGDGGNKPFFLTSEFLTLVAMTLAILIAAAVADNFKAPHAWTLAAVLGVAYMLSRGFAKYERRGGGGTGL